MAIIVDLPRTITVLDRLMARYHQRGLPYSQPHVRLPQEPRHLPRTLDRDPVRHAMFFFTLCYWMRGGTSSVDSTKKLSRLFVRHPDYFDAEVAARFTDSRLELPLRNVGLTGMINSARVFWPENSRRLLEHYDGDPRKIFAGVDSYEALLERVANDKKGGGFMGFGKKMSSMLAYYLIDQGLVPRQDFPVPVDFHLMRIALSNGLVVVDPHPVTGNVRSDALEDTLRALFERYCQISGTDSQDLANALWLLGSNLCSNQPGNRAVQDKYAARSTVITPVPFTGTKRQLHALTHTCGICPIQASCTGNYPSPYYYRRGELVRTGPRPTLD